MWFIFAVVTTLVVAATLAATMLAATVATRCSARRCTAHMAIESCSSRASSLPVKFILAR
ncbi:hypothetical protein EXIGLDRAFT_736212 [Exidia glandulosa HHB12029]|uniref:Uncharacterized protein n=1 Tax=Exidia glandulosa HHB12029 TaxID=1314781 RepID=A0A165Z2Z7_EXIGL|nr:hypothetical protein EXIGLDRAFT_736212 [Exidia glandulosa HHB12029]